MARIKDDRAFAFLQALQEEYELYKSLLHLSNKQKQFIQRAQEDKLIKTLQIKTDILARINGLTQEFKTERRDIEKCDRGTFSVIDDEIDHVLGELEITIRELVERESEDMEFLKEQQAKNNTEMLHVSKGKKLAKAYRRTGPHQVDTTDRE